MPADGLHGVRATAEHLRSLDLTAAYASPSGRTVATASAILSHHPQTPFATDPGLREFSFGDFEARRESELYARIDPFTMFRQVLGGTFAGLPGGEPTDVYLARVARAFETIERTHAGGGSVLVVSHGVTLMAYLTMVGEAPAEALVNASVTTVRVHRDGSRSVLSAGVDPSGVAVPAGSMARTRHRGASPDELADRRSRDRSG